MDRLPNEICINLDEFAHKGVLEAAFLEEYRIAVRRFLNQEENFTRILTNACYMAMYKFIEKCLDGKAKQLIKKNVYKAIEEMPYYSVFRGCFGNEKPNEAYKILMDVVEENRFHIKDKVIRIIDEYPFNELKNDEIGDVIYDCIMDRLFGSKDTEELN